MTDYISPSEELAEWAGELLWKCTRCGYQWHRKETDDRTEVLLFITPRIINRSKSIGQ